MNHSKGEKNTNKVATKYTGIPVVHRGKMVDITHPKRFAVVLREMYKIESLKRVALTINRLFTIRLNRCLKVVVRPCSIFNPLYHK